MDTTMDESHAMQVAAHRWDLFTNFAGTQIADALRENSRADKALKNFFLTSDLVQMKGYLDDVRWGKQKRARKSAARHRKVSKHHRLAGQQGDRAQTCQHKRCNLASRRNQMRTHGTGLQRNLRCKAKL